MKVTAWLLAAVLALGVYVGVHHSVVLAGLDQQVEELGADLNADSDRVDDLNAELETIAQTRESAQATLDTLKAVAAERPAFLASVKAASDAFASADGKVDVSDLRAAVLTAQEAVAAEKSNPENVRVQTATVTDAAAAATAKVTAHDAQKAREAEEAARAERSKKSSGPGQKTPKPDQGTDAGGGNWFDDFRQRLNNVGGGHVFLYEYDGSCGGRFANACSYRDGSIGVHSSAAGWSSARKNWLVVHELAHQYQFAVWDRMAGSAGYRQLFGSDPELLANCMASARGYTAHGHNGSCNSERKAWANEMWSGRVAW